MFGINDLRRIKGFGQGKVGVFCRRLQFDSIGPDAFGRSLLAILALAVLLEPMSLWSAPRTAGSNRKISQAFEKYVRATDSRNNSELQSGTDFLWIDSLPAAARKKAYADLARGEVQLQRRTTLESGQGIPCPECMIHHWEGLVFIPLARLETVLRILEDYGHHAEYYAPDVSRSRLDAHDGDHFRAFLRLRRQKVITVVLNTEHEITYYRDTAFRAHSRSSATHVAEVENPGKVNEREKAREEDNGFLWGMETWWRMEEKDNGMYVQSEVVSLSRDVPAALGWMIGPFVTAVPKESLTFTLEATRKAVLSQLREKDSTDFSDHLRRDFLCAAASSSFRNSPTCASQENDLAVCKPFEAIALRCGGLVARNRMAPASSPGFSGFSRTIESLPSDSQSLTPAEELTTTGNPQDMASRTGRLKESSREGAIRASEAE
jgi:hypothetical protein